MTESRVISRSEDERSMLLFPLVVDLERTDR